jgi:hypothetical protein
MDTTSLLNRIKDKDKEIEILKIIINEQCEKIDIMRQYIAMINKGEANAGR